MPTRRHRVHSSIIVALIDVLIVVLIFLMVTPTFKNQPAVRLTLPESSQSKPGAKDETLPLLVTIEKAGPLFLDKHPLTRDRLQERLVAAARQTPDLRVAINADTDAPVGLVIKVMDAAKAAKIQTILIYTRKAETGR